MASCVFMLRGVSGAASPWSADRQHNAGTRLQGFAPEAGCFHNQREAA